MGGGGGQAAAELAPDDKLAWSMLVLFYDVESRDLERRAALKRLRLLEAISPEPSGGGGVWGGGSAYLRAASLVADYGCTQLAERAAMQVVPAPRLAWRGMRAVSRAMRVARVARGAVHRAACSMPARRLVRRVACGVVRRAALCGVRRLVRRAGCRVWYGAGGLVRDALAPAAACGARSCGGRCVMRGAAALCGGVRRAVRGAVLLCASVWCSVLDARSGGLCVGRWGVGRYGGLPCVHGTQRNPLFRILSFDLGSWRLLAWCCGAWCGVVCACCSAVVFDVPCLGVRCSTCSDAQLAVGHRLRLIMARLHPRVGIDVCFLACAASTRAA